MSANIYAVLYFAVPIFQVVYFVVAHDIINSLAHRMDWIESRGVSWGISVKMFAIEYMIIVALSAIFNYGFPKKRLLIFIASSIIFSGLIFHILNIFPYRGCLVIALGVSGLFLGYLLLKLLKRKAEL